MLLRHLGVAWDGELDGARSAISTDRMLQSPTPDHPALLLVFPARVVDDGGRDTGAALVAARAWGALVVALFGLPVRDIDCAFELFHRRVLEAMPLASLGAFVSTELLVRA